MGLTSIHGIFLIEALRAVGVEDLLDLEIVGVLEVHPRQISWEVRGHRPDVVQRLLSSVRVF